ncbi:unnamed protein product [Moneuplotes crassus]|uniref:Uncharacterized protein n=1 Tax=Euplotes crassus TaxID=5936 RepID=A0AAD1XBT3_EUPCR|nr:unnamed protein product [Moneuplotes crassus]
MDKNTRNLLTGGKNSKISSYGNQSLEYDNPYDSKLYNPKANRAKKRHENTISPNKMSKSVNLSQEPKNKSRLIVRDSSYDYLKSGKRRRIALTSYPKQTNRVIMRMREDLNPENVMNGIEKIDLEIHKLEENIPPDASEDEEAILMLEANKELRERVEEIGMLVKTSLAKVNKSKTVKKAPKETKEEDPELKSRKETRDKIHKEIRKANNKIYRLRKQISSRVRDPREDKLEDNLRTLNSDIETLQDELKIQKKQTKRQTHTLSKEHDAAFKIGLNYDYDQRIQDIKEEMAETKQQVRTREKELKELELKHQHKTLEFLKVQKEFRKVHENSVLLKHNRPTVELQKKKSKKDEEKYRLKKQKDVERQYKNEVTLHSDLMKRFDKFISGKQSQIEQIKAKTVKITDQNQKLGNQMKELKEMAKKLK